MKFLFLLLAFSLQSLRADVTAGEMLMRAEIHGDLSTMESLLSAGFNPNLPLRGGKTPLYFAMQLGNAPVLQLLLAWHADPNAPISGAQFSETPLQYAAETGNVRMASILIAGGAQVNAKVLKGRTALHVAGAGAHLDMIRLLTEKGADVTVKVLFSFAGENEAGTEERSGRKLERTRVELNRNETFGYAF